MPSHAYLSPKDKQSAKVTQLGQLEYLKTRNQNLSLISAVTTAALVVAFSSGVSATPPTVITLTQTPCQFLEPEHGTDHEFKSTRKADCEAINAKSGADRLTKS